MAKKLLIGLIGLVAVFCIYASMQPADFKVSREIKINAPTELVYGQVVDVHLYDAWNPWAKIDPNMKKTFEGPTTGVGAISRWDGNHEVGTGTSTITEAIPNQVVRMRLDFEKPFKNTCSADFMFRTEGNMTSVNWTFNGNHGFIGKIMSVFMNMDKMIGGRFEQGLAQLKSISEAKVAQAAAAAAAAATPAPTPTPSPTPAPVPAAPHGAQKHPTKRK